MKIIADLHTHTIASGHAYSTLGENCAEAAAHGHKIIAVTDHSPAMPGGPNEIYFRAGTPKYAGGVRVLSGVELNMLGFDESYIDTPWGSLAPHREAGGHNGFDLPDDLLARKEFVIASVHGPLCPHGTVEENTAVWLRVIDNPHIDCLGHIDRGFPSDFEQIVKKCKETGTLIELNNHSIDISDETAERIEIIANLCMLHRAPVIVSSDAHTREEVGKFPHIIEMLERLGFPENLVVNADYDRLAAWLTARGVEL